MIAELLADGHVWYRLADAAWANPLEPAYAERFGGRWNPPGSFPALYLNEGVVTARMNLRRFVAGWPYEPEDLRAETGPHLVAATLPRDQRVCDAHSVEGVAAVGLAPTYPIDGRGRLVGHEVCHAIGWDAKDGGLRGLRCRSARSPHGAGHELAWFPATRRSRAGEVDRLTFGDWYWS